MAGAGSRLRRVMLVLSPRPGQRVCTDCGGIRDAEHCVKNKNLCRGCSRQRNNAYHDKNKHRINERKARNRPGYIRMRRLDERVAIRGLRADNYSREEIYNRDSGLCVHCDNPVRIEDMHLDHLVPLSWDIEPDYHPGDTAINVAVSCAQCNLSKHNRRADWTRMRANIRYP
jgi:5-methylcytosine-specific restriction endonuclease McrA